MTSVLWTKVSIRMHPENLQGIQTSSEAVILPKAQISHDQKHRKGSYFGREMGPLIFREIYKVGPLPFITGFITPITRVTRTGSHL